MQIPRIDPSIQFAPKRDGPYVLTNVVTPTTFEIAAPTNPEATLVTSLAPRLQSERSGNEDGLLNSLAELRNPTALRHHNLLENYEYKATMENDLQSIMTKFNSKEDVQKWIVDLKWKRNMDY
ncbi:hypothetical protein HUJ05_001814 [Dendroctonus ponderosae]|nr:hypothetical protein HUJ05_001814 [Dendroctonus ponderosae]